MHNSNMSKLVSIVKQHSNIVDGRNDIDLAANLKDALNIDSLDMVEIIMSIEDKFNIEIDDADIEQIVTFDDLVKLLSIKYKITLN
jgi:acyl carrier protein